MGNIFSEYTAEERAVIDRVVTAYKNKAEPAEYLAAWHAYKALPTAKQDSTVYNGTRIYCGDLRFRAMEATYMSGDYQKALMLYNPNYCSGMSGRNWMYKFLINYKLYSGTNSSDYLTEMSKAAVGLLSSEYVPHLRVRTTYEDVVFFREEIPEEFRSTGNVAEIMAEILVELNSIHNARVVYATLYQKTGQVKHFDRLNELSQ